MKTNSTSRSAFFNARLLVGFALCSVGVLPALAGSNQFVNGTIATKAPGEAPGLWETVLAAGGQNNGQLLASAELYTADGGGGLTLVSAASRLTHGTAGTFDVNMPLSGVSGVECRSATTYNAVFTFDAPVTSGQVTVLSGTATVGAITFSGNSMTAQLTGVTSAEIVTLHTQNINGDHQPHGDVQFGFLTADADASRLVSKPDQTLVQGQLNQPVTSANFREDLTADGRIKNSDLQLVKANKNHSIP